MANLLPIITSFLLTVVLLPFFIQFFNRKKLGQTMREEGPGWHEFKAGTPTMGGTVFIFVSLLISFIFAMIYQQLSGSFWMLWFTFLLFGGIGFIDDFVSIFRKKNEGLTAKQKFLAQIVFSGFIILIAVLYQQNLTIQLFNYSIDHFLLIATFMFIWITGFSNAVNLTDGLDGLATGLSIIAYSTYFLIASWTGEFVVAQFCLIIVGALLGFLVFNIKPAKIFMGDVGSLALGAGLAVISMILRNPWLLILIGLVFVAETLSVIIQVTSFKTRGKRIFKMSPLHHHFEMSGWSESKVVFVFWTVGLLCAVLAVVLFLIN